jgi:hypothetical protein
MIRDDNKKYLLAIHKYNKPSLNTGMELYNLSCKFIAYQKLIMLLL